MRMIVVKAPTSAQDLRVRLGRTDPSRTLDDIAALNPHVDLKAIQPGTVLLIPEPAGDAPATPADDGTAVPEAPFDELREQIVGALGQTNTRIRAGYDALAAQAKDTTAVLKSAAVKRAMDADPALKAQVEAAATTFKQDAAQAKAADQALKSLQKQMSDDLSALQKLLQ